MSAATRKLWIDSLSACSTLEELVRVSLMAFRNEPANLRAFIDGVIKTALKTTPWSMTTGVKPARGAARRAGLSVPGVSQGTGRAAGGRPVSTDDEQQRADRHAEQIAEFFRSIDALDRQLARAKGRPAIAERQLLFVIAADFATDALLTIDRTYVPDTLRDQINKERQTQSDDPVQRWTDAMKWQRQHQGLVPSLEQKGPIVRTLRPDATAAERQAFWAAVYPPADLSRDWTIEQTRKTGQRLADRAEKMHGHRVFGSYLWQRFYRS